MSLAMKPAISSTDGSAVFGKYRYDLLVGCELACIGLLDALVNVTNLPGFTLHTGGLFDGLTIEEMRRGNVSHRRNPLIADLFRRIDMVKAWGRGIPLMLENAPDVAFREVVGLFIASLRS